VRTFSYKQVDVFTTRAGMGNPVGVVLAAESLDAAEMQRLARWTNLSETTFVLPATTPEADYRLRIFSPAHELPFAGHPTVGSAHAALEAGLVSGPEFRQECGAGILPLTATDTPAGRRISVVAPEAKFEREFGEYADAIAAALGMPIISDPPPAAMTNGPVWLFVQLAEEDAVIALEPDMAAVARLSRDHGLSGIAAFRSSMALARGCTSAVSHRRSACTRIRSPVAPMLLCPPTSRARAGCARWVGTTS